MQNVDTRKFLKQVQGYGYVPVRTTGSHTVYERTEQIVVKDSVSIPVADKTVNGCLAKSLLSHIEEFDEQCEQRKVI